MSDTWTALQLARDAWDSGRLSESCRLMPEPDCEYVECVARRECPRFYEDDDLVDLDGEPVPRAVQLAEFVRLSRVAEPTLTEWNRSHEHTKEHLDRLISARAWRIVRAAFDSDAIEIRIASYANIVHPGYSAILAIDSEAL